jgi:hypothetical protein
MRKGDMLAIVESPVAITRRFDSARSQDEMDKARQGKELVLRTANEIDELAKVSKLIAERGMNILAMSCWSEDRDAVIRLVTDDILRTSDVLRENGYEPAEKSVVLIDAAHKPGILRHITDVLSKHDIALSHLFASATIDQDECLVVLNSSNNDRVIVLLND